MHEQKIKERRFYVCVFLHVCTGVRVIVEGQHKLQTLAKDASVCHWLIIVNK